MGWFNGDTTLELITSLFKVEHHENLLPKLSPSGDQNMLGFWCNKLSRERFKECKCFGSLPDIVHEIHASAYVRMQFCLIKEISYYSQIRSGIWDISRKQGFSAGPLCATLLSKRSLERVILAMRKEWVPHIIRADTDCHSITNDVIGGPKLWSIGGHQWWK